MPDSTKSSLHPLAQGFVSDRVVIITLVEYNERISEAFQCGVNRGKFEADYDPAIAAERLACKLVAEGHDARRFDDCGMSGLAVAMEVASEIAQAIAGRDEGN